MSVSPGWNFSGLEAENSRDAGFTHMPNSRKPQTGIMVFVMAALVICLAPGPLSGGEAAVERSTLGAWTPESRGPEIARNRTLVPKAVRLIIGFRQVVTA